MSAHQYGQEGRYPGRVAVGRCRSSRFPKHAICSRHDWAAITHFPGRVVAQAAFHHHFTTFFPRCQVPVTDISEFYAGVPEDAREISTMIATDLWAAYCTAHGMAPATPFPTLCQGAVLSATKAMILINSLAEAVRCAYADA